MGLSIQIVTRVATRKSPPSITASIPHSVASTHTPDAAPLPPPSTNGAYSTPWLRKSYPGSNPTMGLVSQRLNLTLTLSKVPEIAVPATAYCHTEMDRRELLMNTTKSLPSDLRTTIHSRVSPCAHTPIYGLFGVAYPAKELLHTINPSPPRTVWWA